MLFLNQPNPSRMPDGTAALPSIAFASEPGTGIWHLSSGTINFSLQGARVLDLFGGGSANPLLQGFAGQGLVQWMDTGVMKVTAGGSNQSVILTPSGASGTLDISHTGGVVRFLGGASGSFTDNAGNTRLGWNGTTTTVYDQAGAAAIATTSAAATITPATVNQGGVAGAANTNTRFRKSVAAIANAVATAVLTVTIPNAAHSAQLTVTLTGALGAGGAIGAGEATGTIAYSFAIARTAGVNAVVTAATAFGSATASVAGASTITITAAASAISGAVGATNTFTVNVTISRGTGSSTNHTCQVAAELDNANASGITVA